MLETYAVGVKLEMTSNVAGILDKLMVDFEKFNTLVKETSTALNRLGRNLRADSSSVAGLDRMASAMKAAEASGAALSKTLQRNAEFASEAAKAIQSSAKAMEQASRAGSRGASGGHGGRFSEHNVMMGGMAAGMLGGAMLDAVRHTMTPAIDVNRTRDVLAADTRLSPAEVDAALARARETTKLAPGTTTGENLAAILDLKNIFGDLGEAMKLLPNFANQTALFQALDRKGGGSGEQSYAAGKALEVMAGMVDERIDAQGHTVRSINADLGMHRLDMMTRAAVATNMRVMPSDYLGFAKQARVAGMTLSDEFTYEKLPAMLQVLGGQRTGTALMSMAQVFEGGKLEAKSMAALQEIGLAGPGGVTRQGRRTVVHPEAIYDLALMGHDPQSYLEQAQKRMEARGIHGTEAQVKALMRASQRSTIAGIFADLLKDGPAILKEQQNVQHTRMDMAQHMASVDPAAKVQQFEAAITNLATELGSAGMKDAMAVLDAATAGLNKLGDWAHANPTLARTAFDVAAGLGAVATALGALSTAVLVFGPALRLLGAGGGGTAASVAAGVGTGAALPLAVAGAGLAAAVNAGLDPNYRANETARQIAGAKASVQQYAPLSADPLGGQPVQLRGDVNIDGRKVGSVLATGVRGPNTGTTGADLRTGLTGSNALSP